MMNEDLTPEAMNTLVLKTLEKLSEEKKKSLAHIKHFIFAHENQRLLIRFWEIIDEQLPGHRFEYLGCHPETGFFEVTKTPPDGFYL
jgi:hypothetical protein